VAKPSPILLPVDDSKKCGKRKNETTPKSISLSLSLSWFTSEFELKFTTPPGVLQLGEETEKNYVLQKG